MVASVIVAVVLVLLAGLSLAVRILNQYERAVAFRLGRVKGGARGPGLILFVPFVDRVHRVSLQIVTMPIESQGIITRDNVSIDVSAVAYYRVADAIRSVVDDLRAWRPAGRGRPQCHGNAGARRLAERTPRTRPGRASGER